MINTIEITQGFRGGGSFWFCPVKFRDSENPDEEDWDSRTIEIDDLISIDELDIDRYLYDTLDKHFNPNLHYNRYRDSATFDQKQEFEWNLVYNYYTYESMYAIIRELIQQAAFLDEEAHRTDREEDDSCEDPGYHRADPEADAFSIMGP